MYVANTILNKPYFLDQSIAQKYIHLNLLQNEEETWTQYSKVID